ncbi:MAG: 3-dehydroquinate synthase [Lachnospiraceae bacterium]|nr:3-dehydroquinate synthase [Lachnospiraceae bacterium]MBD5500813.1 3-dehydroquinate synthase [Lachnospiraceae bacterium]
MSERITISYERKPCYDIVFSLSFEELPAELEKLDVKSKKVCIITDSRVAELYGDEVMGLLKDNSRESVIYSFPAGEENKTLDTVRDAYEFLINRKFGRKDLLIALGGGVVGDVTGFIAATYLRGVDFIQIPTTLLAQSDSSIGGKTGVDFDGYKNMVGAFYMPKLVYMNVATLKTLDDRQFFNGFAEVMKHGLIKDGLFYEWLLDMMYEIRDRDLDTLMEMVRRSCMVKKLVVEKDPKEKGDRALLNFGHTIGHAIEKAKNFTLPHGECVALGCVAAAFISWKHEWLSMDEYYEIRDMFVPFQLPISIEGIQPEEILALTKSDKKTEGTTIKFVLLKKVGKAVIDLNVTDEDILNAVKELLYTEDGE